MSAVDLFTPVAHERDGVIICTVVSSLCCSSERRRLRLLHGWRHAWKRVLAQRTSLSSAINALSLRSSPLHSLHHSSPEPLRRSSAHLTTHPQRVEGPHFGAEQPQTSTGETRRDVHLRVLREPPGQPVCARQQVRHGSSQEGRGQHLRERQPGRADATLPENGRHEGGGAGEEHLLLHPGPRGDRPGPDGPEAAKEGQVPADRGHGPTAAQPAMTAFRQSSTAFVYCRLVCEPNVKTLALLG